MEGLKCPRGHAAVVAQYLESYVVNEDGTEQDAQAHDAEFAGWYCTECGAGTTEPREWGAVEVEGR